MGDSPVMIYVRLPGVRKPSNLRRARTASNIFWTRSGTGWRS